MKFIFILGCLSLLTSCASPQPGKFTAFPPSPKWATVADPVIGREGDNFVVKPGMVEYALQARSWSKRVQQWKFLNGVP